MASTLFLVGACGQEATVPADPVAAIVEAVSVAEQEGAAGEAANHAPAVRVLDADGRPMAGVRVAFSAGGGSTVVPSAASTGSDGVARVTAWTLAPGAGELTAGVEGLPAVVFRATGHPRAFDLTVRWLSPPTDDARVAVEAAEAFLERVVWRDLPDQELVGTPVCPRPGTGPAAILDEVVDDVLVLAVVEAIDGLGGAGAQGFPCLIRDPGTQTIVGFVRFDEAEMAAIDAARRRDFALHEMVHALGFVPGILNIQTPSGFVRSCLALPSRGAPDPLVQDTHFSCPGAVEGFDRIGGAAYAGAKVPLENGATMALTANTLNHHWRKTSLRDEVMTGWFTAGVPAPFSLVTVGALEDLGYGVTWAAADPFLLAPPIAPAVSASRGDWRLVEVGPLPPILVHRPAR